MDGVVFTESNGGISILIVWNGRYGQGKLPDAKVGYLADAGERDSSIYETIKSMACNFLFNPKLRVVHILIVKPHYKFRIGLSEIRY